MARRPISFFVGAWYETRVRARAYQAQWLQCVPRRMDRISASTDVKWPPRRAGTQTNAPRPARTRSDATATELGAGFRGPPRNESTLRRAAFPSTFSTSPPSARSVFLSLHGRPRTPLNEMSQVSYRSPS